MTTKIDLSFSKFDPINNNTKLDIEVPEFASHTPLVSKIKKTASKFSKKKKMVLIGNGGSNTSFKAFSGALPKFAKKEFTVLQTMEPEVVTQIKKDFSKKQTVLVTTSKSGTNVDSLEPLMALKGYETLAVTQFDNNPLYQYSKLNKFELFEHPVIGGRYSGITASQLMPAAVLGLPVDKIYKGAKEMYKKCSPKHKAGKNPALKLAIGLYNMEKKGKVDIFSAFYSNALHSFQPLLTQLIHESFCKSGKGQTIFGDLGPEMQHHTNQRFFGGRKNAVGLFFNVKKHENEIKLKLSKKEQEIKIRGSSMKTFNGSKLSNSLLADMHGVMQAAMKLNLPLAHVEVDKITPETVGGFTAFLQYFTVYSSVLRNVNPFDQPSVELAKTKAFDLRK